MLPVPAAMPLPSTAGARGTLDLGGAPGTRRPKSVARFVGRRKAVDRLSGIVADPPRRFVAKAAALRSSIAPLGETPT